MKTKYNIFRYTILALTISVLTFIDSGLVRASDVKKIFESDEAIELTLELDMKAVLSDIGDNPEYHLANLIYMQNDEAVNIEVKIKTRGHFRKQRSVCQFPPLKFKLPKDGIENTFFSGQRKLKLVSHCSKKELYESNLLKEYLAYKMYNIITDKSFNVQLAIINYVDIKGKYEPITKYAFFIEDDDLMAERLGGKILKAKNVHPDKTDYDQMTMLSVFQYMIANTDWSVAALHNIKLVSIDPWQAPIAVPYDFDWAGFIDAPYAVPSSNLQIKYVTDRLYRGYYRSEEQLQAVFSIFKSCKNEIIALLANFQYLDPKAKNQNIKYINSFYEIIDNEKVVKREFIDKCRVNETAS